MTPTLHEAKLNKPWCRTFLGRWQMFIWSRNSIYFLKHDGSLPYSQDPATGHYHVQDETSKHSHIIFI